MLSKQRIKPIVQSITLCWGSRKRQLKPRWELTRMVNLLHEFIVTLADVGGVFSAPRCQVRAIVQASPCLGA
jgi:hypothetical protein